MRLAGESPPPPIKAVRPSPSVLKKVHGLMRHKGKMAAIEPESGDIFLGESLLEAFDRGRAKHPGGVFYFVRVGHAAARVHHGGPRRARR